MKVDAFMTLLSLIRQLILLIQRSLFKYAWPPCAVRGFVFTSPEMNSSVIQGFYSEIILSHILLFSTCHIQLFATPWTAACQASLSFTLSQNLLKLMPIELMMPTNHFIFYCSILLLSIFPSIGVFSNELALCIRWPKYRSFKFSINASNEYLGLISFRIDRFDFLAVQGTLKSLLQHHS